MNQFKAMKNYISEQFMKLIESIHQCEGDNIYVLDFDERMKTEYTVSILQNKYRDFKSERNQSQL